MAFVFFSRCIKNLSAWVRQFRDMVARVVQAISAGTPRQGARNPEEDLLSVFLYFGTAPTHHRSTVSRGDLNMLGPLREGAGSRMDAPRLWAWWQQCRLGPLFDCVGETRRLGA